MEAWLYATLDREARRWWYHQQLRDGGNAIEARRRERQSIKSKLADYRALIDNQGVCLISRDGDVSLNKRDGSRVSGCGLTTADTCRRLGVIVVDCRTAEWSQLLTCAFSGPMLVDAVCRPWTPEGEVVYSPLPDPKPWHGCSFVPLATWIAGYSEAGCVVHNYTLPETFERFVAPSRVPYEPVKLQRFEEFDLGPVPAEEDCEQLGANYDAAQARRECKQWIAQLKREHGEPPDGVSFRVNPNRHDFGTYYDVVIKYDVDSSAAAEYARRVEEKLPGRWDDEARGALCLEALV